MSTETELETPKTFQLRRPIQSGADEVAEITLREPTAGDIEQLQRNEVKEGGVAALVKLIASQAKLPPADIRALGARDFNSMQEYLTSFFSQKKENSES